MKVLAVECAHVSKVEILIMRKSLLFLSGENLYLQFWEFLTFQDSLRKAKREGKIQGNKEGTKKTKQHRQERERDKERGKKRE